MPSEPPAAMLACRAEMIRMSVESVPVAGHSAAFASDASPLAPANRSLARRDCL